MKNINYGIDLGTTNSGIAKFENGKVTIYKNPVGFKDTTASVVSFRKGRIQIGEKARDLLVTSNGNVFTSFKRKMGSDEIFYVADLDQNLTPVDLSAYVLKEILSFETNTKIESAVITIPASFDTIQSNATKKAGYQAGLKEVVLLQEPIAACLAYSNYQNMEFNDERNWLVYDFGGGTFDVALVTINSRELKVTDHQGNNFLGGVDLDNLVIEKLICPKIEKLSNETNLWQKIISKENLDYQKLYYELLFKAEEAKKILSLKPITNIEIDNEELDMFFDLDISKEEFESILEPKFNESFHLLEKLLNANSINFQEIERIILVGGTTYIPYIREELHRRTGLIIDNSIDPTTAVISGAAFYAGNKQSELREDEVIDNTSDASNSTIDVQIIYENSSKDQEELIIISAPQLSNGFYRITRQDGGFDTGMNAFNEKVNEFLSLLPKSTNNFKIQLFDSLQNLLYTNENIVISSGLYAVNGQPLPNDISLEIDDINGKTQLERIFKKNDILPVKKTIYKTISKNIVKGSNDHLQINILEGNSGNNPGSNLTIGFLEISGIDLEQDLFKGTDVELNFKISESRDLTIEIFIDSVSFEKKQIFNPHQRNVSITKLRFDLKETISEINSLINEEQEEENYTFLAQLQQIKEDLMSIVSEAETLENDFSTDTKYRLDELKRIIIQDFDDLVRHRYVIEEISNYHLQKSGFEEYSEKANEKQKMAFQKIVSEEKSFLNSGNKYLIKNKAKELENILDDIYFRQDESYYNTYYYLKFKDENEYKDRRKFHQLIEFGDKALERQNINEIKSIINQLYNLLIIKPKSKNDFENFNGNLGLK